MVIAHTPLTVMKKDQLLHQSFHVSVAFGVLGRRVLLLMVAGFVYTHQRKSFRIGWRPFRNGHEAYSLTEKRLGETYKCKVRAMDYPSKIKALEQRSSYFRRWQNESRQKVTGKEDR